MLQSCLLVLSLSAPCSAFVCCPQLLLKLHLLSVQLVSQHLSLLGQACILDAQLASVYFQVTLVLRQGLIATHRCRNNDVLHANWDTALILCHTSSSVRVRVWHK